MTENEIEMMYAEKEQMDIKEWCTRNKQIIRYRGKKYYLYQSSIYDEDMNLIIEYAENGFLDLFEYYEYFPQDNS
jgi:hypothetical protein